MKLLFCLFSLFTLSLVISSVVAQKEPVEDAVDKLTTTTTEEITTEDPTTEDTTTTDTTTTETTTTTTTTTKATTTTEPPPPPPSPPKDGYVYNITTNNVTCIMLEANFNFLVTYNIGGNKTNETTVRVPAPKDNTYTNVDGSCNCTDPEFEGTQYIELRWGSSIPQNSVKLRFNQSEDGKVWHLIKFRSIIYMDTDEFVNGSDNGKVLNSTFNFDSFIVPVNHSYICFTKLEVTNVTTLMENMAYMYPVALNIDNMKLQAFNQIPNERTFVDEVHCEADKIADIVPIAVGCALAALIIIVLIAYIVGRRRRSAAYQSV